MKNKKTILVGLTAALLLSTFTACSRRNHYEDVLESKQESESLAAIPETNGNITGENAPEYETPIILKTGNTPYYEGKTVEDMQAVYRNTSHGEFSNYVTPIGRLYQLDVDRSYFYNKFTGNFSAWCSDPLCDGEDECIWFNMMQINYIGDDHIYFTAQNKQLYRCDLQRNNVEALAGMNGIDNQVLLEMDDHVYICQQEYVPGASSIYSLVELDMKTGNTVVLSGDKSIYFIKIIKNRVFYTLDSAPYDWYETDLTFSRSKLVCKNKTINQYSDQYIVFMAPDFSVERQVYNLDTNEMFPINDIYGTILLSDDYLYYTRNLTEGEIEADPLKDYYTYTWTVTIPRPGPVGDLPIDTVDAKTKGAGKIYRVRVDQANAPEECVLQLTYKDIPVRIEDIEMDGEVIYVTFHNFENFKNFYNQGFDGREKDTRCYGMVDLQNGSVTILDLPKEE